MRKNKALLVLSVLVFLFLLVPLAIITVTAFGEGTAIKFPIQGFTLSWFGKVFQSESFRRSFLTSIGIAVLATVIALIVGVPAAYAIAKSHFRGKEAVKSFFLSPTLVPGVVVGFVLYQFFVLSMHIPVAVSLLSGHFLITLPYVVRVVGSSLDQFDFSIEEAAWTLGCPKMSAFFRIVLPNITSGISAAFMLSFINSFNNIPISMFLTGPGISTFPATLMNYIEYNYDPSVSAVSVLLMLCTAVLMVIVDRTLGIAAMSG